MPICEPRLLGELRIATTTLDVRATGAPEFHDITDRAQRFVAGSGIAAGQLLIHSLHTTAAVVINEREPLLLEDIAAFLERLAPTGGAYRHDDFSVRTVNMTPDEQPNAQAHLRQLLLGGSKQLPVAGGRIVLGRWQRIFWVELDRPRDRRILLQLMGASPP